MKRTLIGAVVVAVAAALLALSGGSALAEDANPAAPSETVSPAPTLYQLNDTHWGG